MPTRPPSKDPKRAAAAAKGWEKRRQSRSGGADSGAGAAKPASPINPAAPKPAGSPPPPKAAVDEALSNLIGVASILYVWYLTRNFDDQSRLSYRDNDDFILTEEECNALTPTFRRLIDLVPGGQGARAAVQIGEHLSVLMVMLSYADRLAPLRAEARNARPARALRRRGPRPPQHQPIPPPPPAAAPPPPPNTQGDTDDGQHPGSSGPNRIEHPGGPAVNPAALGSGTRA